MKHFTTFLLVFCSIVGHSQRIKTLEGSVKNLKGITQYNVIFDYTQLSVTNYESEEAFLEEKMKMREKMLIGGGEKFKEKWFLDRGDYYEPNFIFFFNDYFIKKKKINISENNLLAEYTIKVITNEIYSGYHVGVFSQHSKLRTTIIFYKNDNPENILFKTKQTYTTGTAYDSAERIGNAYSLLGRKLADYLRKKSALRFITFHF